MFRMGFMMFLLSVSLLVVAESGGQLNKKAVLDNAALTPHQRVSQSTVLLLNAINDAQGYFTKEPGRFYREVEAVLDPLIDFPNFTRSVMGSFGSRDYYKSLSKHQRQQYRVNYKRFIEVFRQGLITTYAKGLLAFNGQNIAVLPASEKDAALIVAGNSVEVHQEIRGADKTYKIDYKMRPDKQNRWVVRNVTIEGINVGQLYRNQFIAAMAKSENDFAKVIDGWVLKKRPVIK